MKYLLIAVLVCSSSLLLAMNEKAVLQPPVQRDYIVIDMPDEWTGLPDNSVSLYNGELNLGNRNLRSCIGLRTFANNNVVKLDLSGNHIRKFELGELLRLFPALRSLNCSHNIIHSLRSSMVTGMPAGFTLNLSDNKISRVGQGVEEALFAQRDHGIKIYCDNTSLSEKEGNRLATALEGASRMRSCKKVALTGGTWGLLATACCCAMARGILAEKGQLPMWGNATLFGGFFIFLVGSFTLITLDSLSDCWAQDDAKPNRFSCENI